MFIFVGEHIPSPMSTSIHWALFYADPSTKPPFNLNVGYKLDGIPTEFTIENCEHIPDAIVKMKNWMEMNQVRFAQPFTLLYPIYMQAMNSDYESTMHQIAWLIKDEADKNAWEFGRVGGLSGIQKEDFY